VSSGVRVERVRGEDLVKGSLYQHNVLKSQHLCMINASDFRRALTPRLCAVVDYQIHTMRELKEV
jgi:hypothetical protein